ncbi:MAG: hypothetical protein OQL16_03170 [Gammaproteobacteria bacterium]|nr:hypothetical protein [Gammaproteobacteria bacterium]
MPTITDYYKYSQLATAAYIKLDGKITTNGEIAVQDIIAEANSQGRLPISLAEQLFDSSQQSNGQPVWTIPTGDYYYGNDDFGFAATLFRKGDENPSGNEMVLAIRGTEGTISRDNFDQVYLDLLKADLAQIGFIGFALEQTLSMVNYIERLKADTSDSVLQLKLKTSLLPPSNAAYREIQNSNGDPVYVYFDTEYADGLGLINEGDTLTVTGHSLGGHLAGIAARLYPRLIDEAYLYNAPGTDPEFSDEILGVIQNIISAFVPPLGAIVDILSPDELKMTDELLGLIDDYLGLSKNRVREQYSLI